jgi:hypothetical protein
VPPYFRAIEPSACEKAAKIFFLEFRRHAYTRVLNSKVEQCAVRCCELGVDANVNVAVLGELDGVANQIQKNLAEAAGIPEKKVGNRIGGVEGKLKTFLARTDRAGFQSFVEAFAKTERDGPDLELSGFDFREVQNVVDDRKQRFGGKPREIQMLALFACEVGIQHQFRHAQNAVERRANFVAHGGQEQAFGLAGGFRGALGVLQFVLGLLALRNVLGRDNDAANFALCITPGMQIPADPLGRTVGAYPVVFIYMLLLPGQAAAVGIAPFFREIGNSVVQTNSG